MFVYPIIRKKGHFALVSQGQEKCIVFTGCIFEIIILDGYFLRVISPKTRVC